MGKAQKDKKRKGRTDPTGLNGGVVGANGTSAEDRQQVVLPILKKLRSLEADDRAWAATALSNFVLDANIRKQLLAGGVVDGLLVLLTDVKAEVAVEAAGALRNLAISGGSDVSGEILRKNGLSSLLALIPKISGWIAAELEGKPAETDVDKFNRKAAFLLAEQVIALLWMMGEEFDSAVKTITTANVFPFLLDLLNPPYEIPYKVVQVAGQCLNTLTEENDACYPIFQSTPDYAERLASISSGTVEKYNSWDENRIIVRVLAANVLYNVREAFPAESSGRAQVFSSSLAAVSVCLDYDLAAASQQAVELAHAVDSTPAPTPKKGQDVDLKGMVTKESERLSLLESHLGTLQLVLELLANMYSEDLQEEGGEEWEDADEAEGDDDDDEAAKLMEGDAGVFEESAPGISSMEEDLTSQNPSTSSLLFSPELITKVIRLCASAPPTASPAASKFVAQVGEVQLRALGCANNMFAAAGKEWYEVNAADVLQFWAGLFEIAHAAAARGAGFGAELVEAAVNTMWTLSRVVDGFKVFSIRPTADQVNALVQTGASSQSAESLRVKVVGVLGILGKLQGQVDLNKAIGVFLMTTISTSNSPEIIAEALNAMYDIYADKEFDYDTPVFVQGGFLEKLKALYPSLRAKAKGVDKRKLRAVRERVDEALLNLRAFIQYKEKERR
ncbi:hypothetical protein HK104_009556 [Borealophlyctis nickersoniae]|nr:hypothetical protein HK104_009556 [Borealophlyctis nickersoniae]